MMSNQATEHKYINRWLKKREFLSYYLIYKVYGSRNFNIGEASDLLIQKFCCSRKVAYNIIKRLYKTGLLIKVDKAIYKCRDLHDALDSYLSTYILKRCRQRERESA
ncbi:MAG: hypothetical protein DRO40_05530 [Thermoprotei archaeon]|nr:MAG: hypothetical protein DRO40_05530 [Thermoprotei archaeon]